MMKAVIATKQGSPDVLQITDLPLPEVGPGQVRVRVYASSVNPIDTKIRQFNLPMTPRKFPAIIQSDMAGIIDTIGPGVTRFVPGDRIFGFAGGFHGPEGDIPGTLAQYSVVDANLIAHSPKTADFRTAAALPLIAVTAWKALFEKVRISPRDRVLIIGGAGSVGSMAVQLACLAGADVVAVTRSEQSAKIALSAGARKCVDLDKVMPKDLSEKETAGQGFDVIFDTVGGEALDAAFELIRPGGNIVSVAGASTRNLAPLYLKGANLDMQLVLAPIMFGHNRTRQGEILEKIADLYDSGHLTIRIDPEHFTLETAAKAHQKLESGKAQGKLVIDIPHS